MLAVGLGVPLSWVCLAAGPALCAKGFSAARIRRGDAVARSDLESLVGRLLWLTGGVRWLRPWMSVWFRMLVCGLV